MLLETSTEFDFMNDPETNIEFQAFKNQPIRNIVIYFRILYLGLRGVQPIVLAWPGSTPGRTCCYKFNEFLVDGISPLYTNVYIK
jgi:hypothetical protein